MNAARARRVLRQTESVLRGGLPERHAWWIGPRLVLLAAPVAGLAVGSFSATSPARAWFMVFAAIKLPLLVLGTAALCLPGYFVLHAVLGKQRDFPLAVRGVLRSQALFALILAALAPVIPVRYSAASSHQTALLGVGGLFALASAVSIVELRRSLRSAGLTTPTHNALTLAWLGLYALVATQFAWILRPFVGTPGTPIQFLRDGAFSNGYVVVFEMVFGR